MRGFELLDANHACGAARKGEAQEALEELEIDSIELHHANADGLIITMAFALRKSN